MNITDFNSELANILYHGKNNAFRYHDSPDSIKKFIQLLKSEQNIFTTQQIKKHTVFNLIRQHDFMFLSFYILFYKKKRIEYVELLDRIANASLQDSNKLKYLLFHAAYNLLFGGENRHNNSIYKNVQTISELFVETRDIKIYSTSHDISRNLNNLLKTYGNNFDDFINLHFDIPGLNALSRNGLVKLMFLPSGHVVVCKQSNKSKPEIFQNEIKNYEVLKNIFCKQPTIYALGYQIHLNIIFPEVIIYSGTNNSNLLFSEYHEGQSLEDLLMRTDSITTRKKLLFCCRWILDTLFDHGVLWNDMSPRNILFEEKNTQITLSIFDFEKAQIRGNITKTKISLQDRKNFCRGQIFSEEWCILCSLKEIKEFFSDYFTPEQWLGNLKHHIVQNKRFEILDILFRRNITINEFAYNALDYQVTSNKNLMLPLQNRTNKVFIAFLGFKVEHYLSMLEINTPKVYENKITELLLLLQNDEDILTFVNKLDAIISKLEYLFLVDDFLYLTNDCRKIYQKQKIAFADEIVAYINNTYHESFHDKQCLGGIHHA